MSNAHPGRAVVRHEGVLIMAASRQIVCPQCAAVNRVPAEHFADVANYGACKQPLFVAEPLDVDQVMFKRHVARSSIPVLIDVWAPWCGPCHMMAPAFANAVSMLEPDMRLVKLNSQDEPEMASQLRIRGVPTMLLFVNGRGVARTSGAMNTSAIVAWAREQAVGYN